MVDKNKIITNQIVAIILEEMNGYTPQEIKDRDMVKESEGSPIYERIEYLLNEYYG